MWERRRIIKSELRTLLEAGCPCRLSFLSYRSGEFVNVSSYIVRSKEYSIGRMASADSAAGISKGTDYVAPRNVRRPTRTV